MRTILSPLFAVALVAAVAAPAAAAPAHPLGVTLEAGAPDLLGVRLTVRPRPWLRLNVGPVSDVFSAGIGAGVTFVPLGQHIVSPSLTVDGGYLFDGDTRALAGLGMPASVGHAAYGYVDGHAGLEIGASRRVCVYLHAGVSYVDLTAHGDGYAAAHLRLWGPSAKLGLTVFL